ncbi:MAG: hypothetical protein AAF762_11890 [Pseudomonadota bacterium]
MRFCLAVLPVLVACAPAEQVNRGAEPALFTYTEPESSGLIGVRPYPKADDVCQVIGENDATREFLDDSALLVGCPKHEFGAIADRQAKGAMLVGHALQWSLFSVPLR